MRRIRPDPSTEIGRDPRPCRQAAALADPPATTPALHQALRAGRRRGARGMLYDRRSSRLRVEAIGSRAHGKACAANLDRAHGAALRVGQPLRRGCRARLRRRRMSDDRSPFYVREKLTGLFAARQGAEKADGQSLAPSGSTRAAPAQCSTGTARHAVGDQEAFARQLTRDLLAHLGLSEDLAEPTRCSATRTRTTNGQRAATTALPNGEDNADGDGERRAAAAECLARPTRDSRSGGP